MSLSAESPSPSDGSATPLKATPSPSTVARTATTFHHRASRSMLRSWAAGCRAWPRRTNCATATPCSSNCARAWAATRWARRTATSRGASRAHTSCRPNAADRWRRSTTSSGCPRNGGRIPAVSPSNTTASSAAISSAPILLPPTSVRSRPIARRCCASLGATTPRSPSKAAPTPSSPSSMDAVFEATLNSVAERSRRDWLICCRRTATQASALASTN